MKKTQERAESAPRRRDALRAWLKKPPVRYSLKAISAVFKCLLTIVLIGTITASIVGCVMVVYVVQSFRSDTGIPNLDNISLNETSIVYIKNPETGQFQEHQRLEGTKAIWTDLENIPLNMQNAIIAIEDKRFYDHDGVDWKRTVSAFANLLLHFSSQEYGGSTITQQLIKVLTKENDHKIERKITEILRAIEMERNYYTKDEILEAYLNVLPLSSNVVGVGAAANYYFGKDIGDLSLAECALIAGITQNPSRYNPYTHPENIRQRQRLVLRSMYEQGHITADEYRQAYGEELVFQSSIRHVDVQDYYADLLIQDVIDDLMDKYGYSETYATNMVYFGGLRIESAEVLSQQEKIESIYANDANFPSPLKNDKENPQGAILIMEYDGRVVATAGGRGQKEANRIANRATQSTRQPGSSMKPIGVYGPAVEMNLIHFSSLYNDTPITYDGIKWPPNYSNIDGNKAWTYRGYTISEALQRSLNTVPAQIITEELTLKTSFDFLSNKFHLSTLVTARQVPVAGGYNTVTDLTPSALALGGTTDGVKCIDMAAAYQAFGNGGIYNKPYTYYTVRRGNELLLENVPTNERAISESTAYVMNRLLQNVVRGPVGTGKRAAFGEWPIFAKTGTTDNNNDVYFAGGTPYFVAASWFGYDHNKEMNSSQTGYALNLWKQCMQALHEGLELRDFDKTGNTVEYTFCLTSGQLANSGCPDTAVGVYKPENIPGNCASHDGTPLHPSDDGQGSSEPTTEPTPETTTTTAAVPATTTTATAPTTKPTQGTTDPPIRVPTTTSAKVPSTAPTDPSTSAPSEPSASSPSHSTQDEPPQNAAENGADTEVTNGL
ncbi:MAG: transglycosylase [Clostridiales bacterium]|nr:transglycosylase [Clostridiales bacterium]